MSEVISAEQRHKLDSIASKDVPIGAPGIAAGIVIDGKIVYDTYAGYADLTDSSLIGEHSRFNIASNGKQFTALAILMLVEKGKLSLDDDLRIFFPALYPDIKESIQIKHLLNHSSGIRDVYRLWGLQGLTWWEHTFDNSDALALLGKQDDLNFEPGSQYLYSNSNYILLAEIIGKVSGSTFVDYTTRMFQDLNMPNTSFVSDHTHIAGPIAKPYFNFDTWFGYEWIWNIHGDGNIFSTLQDQLQWEMIVQTKQSDVFSEALLNQSQSLIPNTDIEQYGYGLEFGKHKEIPYSFHGGSTGAWKAIAARFAEGNFSIITLTNSGKTDPMGQTLQMADVLLKLDEEENSFLIEPEKTGDFVSMEDILGIYEFPTGYIMRFVEKEGELYMQRSGRNDIKLLREADNVFHQWNDAPFKQEFTKNDMGEMQITAYYPTVAPSTLTRTESDWTGVDYKALEGQYVNTETDVSATLSYVEDRIYRVKIGKQKISAVLLTPTELLVDDYRLYFSRTASGSIDELFLSSGRIQKLRFVRKGK